MKTLRDLQRKQLLSFTRRAYSILPRMTRPDILDIGCGSGIPTLELARLSGGFIVGTDIDQTVLNRMNLYAKEADLSDSVSAVCASMTSLCFAGGSFDVVWSEGAIDNVGFQNGLIKWRDLLVPNGFMVVHDTLKDSDQKSDAVPGCGYLLLSRFELTPADWWREYFGPLQKILNSANGHLLEKKWGALEIESIRQEIVHFDRYDTRYGSVYFVLQKN